MSEVLGLHTDEIEVPEKVQVDIDDGQVTVKGPLGEVSRKLFDVKVEVVKQDSSVFVVINTGRAKHRALMGTFAAHIRNMVHGVTEGFECSMKVVYAHFPIKASVKGDTFVIENFLGEKHPRRADILGKTKVVIKGDQVVISGLDIEEVGQTAANIERATKIKGFDPRIFQDGIYITKKAKR
ncbi:MAG: 50S ribosomal protein L6 [Candidatus Thermoplasmatota archaeon]|nr:50S ribosomal protein L6 [Candidatus Thermoplasmatota archaeon]